MNAEKKILTTFEAGRYCGVNPYTVRHWIENGKLSAYTTPGGHRRIRKDALDAFMKKHNMPLPQDFEEGSKRVLIVDGDPVSAKHCVTTLKRISSDLAPKVAGDGFQAGSLLHSFKPHIVFLELEVPGLDGFSVLKAIKTNPQLSHIRVFVLTAQATEANIEAASASGAEEILSKPLEAKYARKLIKQIYPHIPLHRSSKEL